MAILTNFKPNPGSVDSNRSAIDKKMSFLRKTVLKNYHATSVDFDAKRLMTVENTRSILSYEEAVKADAVMPFTKHVYATADIHNFGQDDGYHTYDLWVWYADVGSDRREHFRTNDLTPTQRRQTPLNQYICHVIELPDWVNYAVRLTITDMGPDVTDAPLYTPGVKLTHYLKYTGEPSVITNPLKDNPHFNI